MTNKYLSRYAKNDTHFHRTDPFKYAYFDDDRSFKLIDIILVVVSCAMMLAVAYGIISEHEKKMEESEQIKTTECGA